MSLKRKSLEGLVSLIATIKGKNSWNPALPRKIFVLRNNDIGDLLVITPIFEVLKKAFPRAEIIAGIGSWNLPVLENNPFVDTILPINAPWHNKQSTTVPHHSPRGFLRSLKYILFSEEAKALTSMQCDVGVDVLGSPEGALLMLRANIPNRIGVKGYAGGHSACQKNIHFNPKCHVSQACLHQAALLTEAYELKISTIPKPQLYLSENENAWAKATWEQNDNTTSKDTLRVLIGMGAGLQEKCWPPEYFGALIKKIDEKRNCKFIAVGGAADKTLTLTAQQKTPSIINLCGLTTLRETFALSRYADLILCNSSMLMHAGAAFNTRTAVFLGPDFSSAQEHALIWGYPTSIIFGPEPSSPTLTTPEEAYQNLEQKQWI